MSDLLVEISRKDLSNLRALYTAKDPNKYIAYMTISNYMRWFEKDPTVKDVHFYCLNSDFSDGTFVVIFRYFVFVDTLDDSFDKLTRLLSLIDCSKGYHFSNVRTEVAIVIKSILQEYSIAIDHEIKTLLYCLPKEKALKLDVKLPVGVQLRPITKLEDLEKVNSTWKYGDDTTFPFVQAYSKHNPNVGAFTYDGTLVAWIFQSENGMMGMLQTDEKYYGHGYGALVTKYLAKKVAESGFDVYVEIVEDNKPSRSLFAKCGFETVGRSNWILTSSPTDN